MSVASASVSNEQLSDEQLRALYAWIDAIPLSRPKRNIQRDFSDGVLLAEVVAVYFPALVEIHNYGAANSVKQKVYNFDTLNNKVLKKLGYNIPRSAIDDVVNCRPGAIESVLNNLQLKMAKYREKKALADAFSPQGGNGNHRETPRDVSPRNGNTKNSARGHGGHRSGSVMASVDEEILMEKETQIRELQETVEILELKIAKLEQLVRLKDNKIAKLTQRN
jgi:hypothetical protein